MAKFMMIDENVRRRLFWLLQRISSYSLWQRKRNAWAQFAEKYEEALKTWSEEKTSGFDPKGIINIYDALRLYDEGLTDLATGNRQVWQRKTGAFHQLARPVDLVESFFWGPCHERWVHVEPYPDHVIPLDNLRFSAEYRGDDLLYPPQDNVCNIIDADYLLDSSRYNGVFHSWPYPIFPKNLPPVPDNIDVIIKTGDIVPCDGIWEPVKLRHSHKFLVIPTEVNGFNTRGAFNYFIRGMTAPLQHSDGFNVDAQWRLVWEDTRYCDGVIPDESEYFLNEAKGLRIQCRSGEKCPHSGQWATLAGGQQQFAYVWARSEMPEAKVFNGAYREQKLIPAVWSLLDRDDGGSPFEANPGENH